MAMLYELDEVEQEALFGMVINRARADLNDGQPLTEMSSRPGERAQEFWCAGCRKWHEASVLGGIVGDPHGKTK